jgi:predicted transcriptional regulator YdeE
MKNERISVPNDLVIVGLAIRTSPAAAGADIAAVWQRFMSEGTAQRLERDLADASVYAVYCDYQSDHDGPYSMVLGVAVHANAPVPAGLRRVRVPAGPYARFVASGDMGTAVWEVWSHVNGVWERPGTRRYIADFERYAPDAMADGKVTADVMVGLAQ